MSSGDDLELGTTNGASDRTVLVGHKSRPSVDFTSNTIFHVAPARVGTRLSPDRDVTAVVGIGNRGGRGIVGEGGFQDRAGTNRGSTGVAGFGGNVAVGRAGGTGVFGAGSNGSRNEGGIGVMGVGGVGDGQFAGGPGVFGTADGRDGVIGATSSSNSGVFGFNSVTRGSGAGVFGRCDSPDGVSVSGQSTAGTGVFGFSNQGIGVLGRSDAQVGVFATSPNIGTQAVGGIAAIFGQSQTGHGVVALAPTVGRFAGAFGGDVVVFRNFTVLGAKSCAVHERNNSYRRFYSVESPESWFEDFGEARLSNGRAVVRIPRDLAPFIRTNRYHVFITPYGKCNGLAVTRRNAREFEVSELNGGKSKVGFSYRIVAKRADIAGKRLEKMRIDPLETPAPIDTKRMVQPQRDVRGLPKGESGGRTASFAAPKARR